jgi:hypothetical protein
MLTLRRRLACKQLIFSSLFFHPSIIHTFQSFQKQQQEQQEQQRLRIFKNPHLKRRLSSLSSSSSTSTTFSFEGTLLAQLASSFSTEITEINLHKIQSIAHQEEEDNDQDKKKKKRRRANDQVLTKTEHEKERKFHFFVTTVLEQLLTSRESRVLIFIPSYFDFIKVRNYCLQESLDVAFISEYSRESEISRSRTFMFQNIKSILIYTGRAHFFHRLHIRGINKLIFYSLPESYIYFQDLCLLIQPQKDFKNAAYRNNQKKLRHVKENEDILPDPSIHILISTTIVQTMQESTGSEEGENRAKRAVKTSKVTSFDQYALKELLGSNLTERFLRSGKRKFTYYL